MAEGNGLVECHNSVRREKLNLRLIAADQLMSWHITTQYRCRDELQCLFPKKYTTAQLSGVLIQLYLLAIFRRNQHNFTYLVENRKKKMSKKSGSTRNSNTRMVYEACYLFFAQMRSLACHRANGSMMSRLIYESLQTVNSCNVHIIVATNYHMRSRSSVPSSVSQPILKSKPEIVWHRGRYPRDIKPAGLILEQTTWIVRVLPSSNSIMPCQKCLTQRNLRGSEIHLFLCQLRKCIWQADFPYLLVVPAFWETMFKQLNLKRTLHDHLCWLFQEIQEFATNCWNWTG